jgi:beta-N-acetylhexosaminidase
LEDPEAVADAGDGVGTDPLIEELLASLTLRQRIGQRFIARIPGSRVGYGAGRAIVEVAPAGFIVYPWNFDSADGLRQLTGSLQQLAQSVTPGISLLLCADQEGGRVATFRFPEFVRVPAAHTMGELGSSPIEAAAYLTGVQMRDLGLNMNLAPVLDVYGTADNSIIGDRSYSGDPAMVAGIVEPYLRGADKAGIISVAKHFPGHGLTTVDSHGMLPVVDATLDAVRSRDLIPFAAAIDAGIEVIMTAHILFESVDPFYPVTLSRLFLIDLLRDELGFDGVVMSDGLEMGAIRDNYSLTETLILLFRNDVDLMLLFVNYDVVDLVDQVEELVRAGELTEDDINRGVRRVLRLKLEHGLADPEAL